MKTKQLTIRIPERIFDNLVAMAQRQGVGHNTMARLLLSEFLSDYKEAPCKSRQDLTTQPRKRTGRGNVTA